MLLITEYTIWYDTICYFNVSSKAESTARNQKLKSGGKNYKVKKRICSEVSLAVREIRWVSQSISFGGVLRRACLFVRLCVCLSASIIYYMSELNKFCACYLWPYSSVTCYILPVLWVTLYLYGHGSRRSMPPLEWVTSLRRHVQAIAPLLRHIGCVVSETTAGAIVQGLLAAGGKVCSTRLSSDMIAGLIHAGVAFVVV